MRVRKEEGKRGVEPKGEYFTELRDKDGSRLRVKVTRLATGINKLCSELDGGDELSEAGRKGSQRKGGKRNN